MPAEALELIAKNPMPIPFAMWRRLYMHFGSKGFEKMAAANGVDKEQLVAQPYAI